MDNAHRFAKLVLLVAATACAAGCGDARPLTGGRTACVAWNGDVDKLLQDNCAKCHSGATPAGGYDVTTYTGALYDKAGRAVAVAGNQSSLILTTLDPATASAPHQGLGDKVLPKLKAWVGTTPDGGVATCGLNVTSNAVHADRPGLMNRASADFHGTWVRSLADTTGTYDKSGKGHYDTRLCQTCHGADLKGGTSGTSCSACHQGKLVDQVVDGVGQPAAGADTCLWCHEQPPQTGAHIAHFKGANFGTGLDCGECHVKPADYTDPGHIVVDRDGGVAPVITFGDKARWDYAYPDLNGRKGPPTYDESGKCTNVYCHGGALPSDASAKVPVPSWFGGASQAECGACHGLPPATANHQSDRAANCVVCHPKVVDSSGKLIDKSRHLDHLISLGDEKNTCTSCHGGGTSGAPPPDFDGNTAHTVVTVGAHTAHLQATHRLRGPLACGECHTPPPDGKPEQAGHLDYTGRPPVFPATAAWKGIARNDSATAVWDRGAATCTNVYCHGGGTALGTDLTPTLHRTPLWTGESTEAECGTCHGVPPQNAAHGGVVGLGSCFLCHSKSIDAFGNFQFSGDSSPHINGAIETDK